MKRTLAAVALVVIFTLALAAPALGQDMNYEAVFNFDGSIDFEMQAGHYCNTGAEMQQTIKGQGSMTKALDVYMENGMIAVDDTNDWVTAPDAIRNLTVTTGILLCAPAKHVYDPTVDPDSTKVLSMNDISEAMRTDGYVGKEGTENSENYKAISDQIWTVQVAANPGFSGHIDMGFEAAHSNNFYADKGTTGNDLYNATWTEDVASDTWDGLTSRKVGPWFPGSFFNIEQYSRTSSGTHRRYIDISSPNTHGYLSEEMTVVGMSEVWEEFSFTNAAAGDEVGMLWHDMF